MLFVKIVNCDKKTVKKRLFFIKYKYKDLTVGILKIQEELNYD